MGIRSTLVTIVTVASTLGQPAQPQQYQDFFGLFKGNIASYMETMPDGSRVFDHGWITSSGANHLSYREGIRDEGETRYLITCHGAPQNPDDKEWDSRAILMEVSLVLLMEG